MIRGRVEIIRESAAASFSWKIPDGPEGLSGAGLGQCEQRGLSAVERIIEPGPSTIAIVPAVRAICTTVAGSTSAACSLMNRGQSPKLVQDGGVSKRGAPPSVERYQHHRQDWGLPH